MPRRRPAESRRPGGNAGPPLLRNYAMDCVARVDLVRQLRGSLGRRAVCKRLEGMTFIQEAWPMSHERSPRGLVEESPQVVLVVDDNDDLRDMIVALLEEYGFQTAAAANGAEAVAWFSRGHRPDLIVLDLMMPVMDGWETLKWLKAQRELSGIPVVIVSAGTDRPAAAAYFVQKPFDCDALIEILRSCTGEAVTAG